MYLIKTLLFRIVEGGNVRTSLTGVTIGIDVSASEKVWRTFQSLGNIAFAYSYSNVLIEIQVKKIRLPFIVENLYLMCSYSYVQINVSLRKLIQMLVQSYFLIMNMKRLFYSWKSIQKTSVRYNLHKQTRKTRKDVFLVTKLYAHLRKINMYTV